MTKEALEEAFLKAEDSYYREHVCPYFYMHKHRLKRSHFIAPDNGYHAPQLRLVLDTEEDYIMLTALHDLLCINSKQVHDGRFIIKIAQLYPWLRCINKNIIQKKKYNSLKEEKNDVISLLEKQGFFYTKKYLDDLSI